MYIQGEVAYTVPLFPMRYARHLTTFMESQGIHSAEAIRGTSITEARLTEPDGFLSISEALSVLKNVREQLDDEHAAFRFGQSLDLAKHGLLGQSLLLRHDVKKLLISSLDYLRFCFPLMDTSVSHDDNRVSIRLEDVWDLGDLKGFVSSIYLGSLHTLMSSIGNDFTFDFNASTTLSITSWQSLVNEAPIKFGAKLNQISMAIPETNQPVNYDTISSQLSDTHVTNSDQKGRLNVFIKVRQQITSEPGRSSTLERIAQQLGMCTRSVRRHLRLAGYSFQDVRNEVRETYATRYLKNTNIPLEKIAEELGYSDQASFTKAYRTWTGKTPGSVRRANAAANLANATNSIAQSKAS